ncbi:MAG: helix-turn-helix domain-containing protein [Candidatus Obscuribacterales bacterium]|nr:helix-turn-helix domain-containing protein [Candidatus Obscuribacterales bacterium]
MFFRFNNDLSRTIVDNVEYVVYATHMSNFGSFIRERREHLQTRDRARFSLRRIAQTIDIEPSYLSKIERGQQPPPGEETIVALATQLEVDPDVLLALAGKVSRDLQLIIRTRPVLFAEVIRQLRDMPDHAVLRVVREVRDGNW